MEIPIPGKDGFHIEMGSRLLHVYDTWKWSSQLYIPYCETLLVNLHAKGCLFYGLSFLPKVSGHQWLWLTICWTDDNVQNISAITFGQIFWHFKGWYQYMAWLLDNIWLALPWLTPPYIYPISQYNMSPREHFTVNTLKDDTNQRGRAEGNTSIWPYIQQVYI